MTSRHACAPTNCWPRRSSLTGDHHDHAPVAPHVDARYDAAARGARGHQEDGLGRGRAAPPRLRARGQGRPVRRASADAGARLGPPGGLRGGGARLAVGHRGGARAAAARVRRAGRARKGARLCHDHEPGGPRARGRGRRGAEHPRGRRHRARARSAPGRRVQLPVRAAQRPGPDARGDGAGRPSPDRAPARHVPPRAHRRLAARDRGRAAGGDRLRAVQRRAARRPRGGQGARPPAAGAGERAVQGVLRRVRPAGLHRLRELRGAQPRRVEAPGGGRGARGARRDARRDAVTRGWLVVGLLLLTIGRTASAAAAPEGELTWAMHVSLAPTWFDPAETPGVIVPFMVLYALPDALAKPMPGAPMAPSLAESWSVSPDGLVRLYHSSDEVAVAEAMAALMRGHVPFVESFGDERVVTRRVPCDIELLLLLAGAVGEGLDRTALSKACKYPPPRVSEAIRRLSDNRYVHQTRDGKYHITGPGERFLAEQVASQGEMIPPLVTRR